MCVVGGTAVADSVPRFFALLLAAFVPLALHGQSNYATPYAITTFAGQAASGDIDGTGSAARFREPFGVAMDGAGNAYGADSLSNTIRKITPAGVVTTFAGAAGSSGSTNGTGSSARFNFPTGVATDGAGNISVADTYNYTIRKITAAGVVTTFAGSTGSAGATDGPPLFRSFLPMNLSRLNLLHLLEELICSPHPLEASRYPTI